MMRKWKRNRASATKTKFDLQIVAVTIPAVPKMKEISKGDIVNVGLERAGKIITHTEDVTATYNPRDNGITLKFKQEMSLVSTMYKDTSNTKYMEKKAKLRLRVKYDDSDKYGNVGDCDLFLDELALIYDDSMEAISTKNLKIRNCSAPGVMLSLKFNVSAIGGDDVVENAYETDTVISDTTAIENQQFEEVDLREPSGLTSGSSSRGIMDRYNEEVSQAKSMSNVTSFPKASMGDYSRNGSRANVDLDYLRKENDALRQDLDKYKSQCMKLNEQIEHLEDQLAESNRKADRISREKEELARSYSAQAYVQPQKSFTQKLFSCGKNKNRKHNSYEKNFDSIQPQRLNDEDDVQMLSR